MHCELCDKNIKAKWKCMDCNQRLCDHCKASHLRISSTRNHKISELFREKYAANVDEVELPNCKHHPRNVLQKYCMVCSKSVCQECIDEHHASHQTVRVSNIYLTEKRKELSELLNSAGEKLVALSFSTESIHKNRRLNDTTMRTDIDAIRHKEETLIAIVKSVSDEYVRHIKHSHDEERRALKEKEETIKTLMEELEDGIKTWNDKLKMKTDVSFIKFVSDATEKLHTIETCIPADQEFSTSTSKFIPVKESSLDDIQKLFGEISGEDTKPEIENKTSIQEEHVASLRTSQRRSIDNSQLENHSTTSSQNRARPPKLQETRGRTLDHVERTSAMTLKQSPGGSFDYGVQGVTGLNYMDGNVTGTEGNRDLPSYATSAGASGDGFVVSTIKPGKSASLVVCTNNQQSWIANSFYYGSKTVSLITSSGEILRDIEIGVQLYDMAITGTGELVVSVSGGSDVKRLTGNNNFVTIANMEPFQTRGLCAIDKDILICLSQEDKGKVVRMTMSGKVKQTIEQDDQGRLIVTKPTLVRENADGNICIVDNAKILLVTDNRGNIRFTYRGGIGAMRKEFRCLGMACDKLGNILLSDDWNHQVHLLDKRGKFIKFLPLNEHGITNPLGMSIDSSAHLWLCNSGGDVVSIVNYLP